MFVVRFPLSDEIYGPFPAEWVADEWARRELKWRSKNEIPLERYIVIPVLSVPWRND